MATFDWGGLFDTPFWAHLLTCSEEDADSLIYPKVISREVNTGNSPVVRIVRGRRCETKTQLLQEWAAALQFPYYFGHNWDAWEECLSDLEWLPGTAYVFFLTNVDLMLLNDAHGFKILVSALRETSREWESNPPYEAEWRPGPVPFRIVFHCEPESESRCRERLAQAGLQSGEYRVVGWP